MFSDVEFQHVYESLSKYINKNQIWLINTKSYFTLIKILKMSRLPAALKWRIPVPLPRLKEESLLSSIMLAIPAKRMFLLL